jgi:hypothetical protein
MNNLPFAYTYDDVYDNVDAIYDCFHVGEKNEFMLIAALSFAAELNFELGFSLKKINSLFRKCEEEHMVNMHKQMRESQTKLEVTDGTTD